MQVSDPFTRRKTQPKLLKKIESDPTSKAVGDVASGDKVNYC